MKGHERGYNGGIRMGARRREEGGGGSMGGAGQGWRRTHSVHDHHDCQHQVAPCAHTPVLRPGVPRPDGPDEGGRNQRVVVGAPSEEREGEGGGEGEEEGLEGV